MGFMTEMMPTIGCMTSMMPSTDGIDMIDVACATGHGRYIQHIFFNGYMPGFQWVLFNNLFS